MTLLPTTAPSESITLISENSERIMVVRPVENETVEEPLPDVQPEEVDLVIVELPEVNRDTVPELPCTPSLEKLPWNKVGPKPLTEPRESPVVSMLPPVELIVTKAPSSKTRTEIAAFAPTVSDPNVMRAADRVRTDLSGCFIFSFLFSCWLWLSVRKYLIEQ